MRDPKFHPLLPDRNLIPNNVSRIHLMGICGTGMAALAGGLKEMGFEVRGSDRSAYPPMSTFLKKCEIPILMGFGPQNLHPEPDLVIIGNVVTRDNPEVLELAELNIPFISFPQALNHFAMKGSQRIVIAGIHGKTTTSSLVAWLLEVSGIEPGFMIGGIPKNFKKGFRLGKGRYFVVEGDEYDTAFFDKGPKFFHYSPDKLILTSIEYDHADIYACVEDIIANFRKLVSLVPPQGHIVANIDDSNVMDVIAQAKCIVVTYGTSNEADFKLDHIQTGEGRSFISIRGPGGKRLRLATPIYGTHNLLNLTAAVALTSAMGLPEQEILRAASTFQGIRRRQEKVEDIKGILVLDDFAHHPTAVKETISAVKEAFPQKRLVAVFEPRSNSSRRNVFQEEYAKSFFQADLAMIPEPTMLDKIPPAERFSSKRLVKEINNSGTEAYHCPDASGVLRLLLEKTRSGDVVLFMSNGDFGDLPRRFVNALKQPAN